MREFQFRVNGVSRTVHSDPAKPLIKVIREQLGLTGTKEGCSTGHCGTCAVLLDGKVVLACRLEVAKAAGKSVVTIEGLGTPESPHPLQAAFAAGGAVQCGFCTPGVIIRAKSLLDKNASPARREIAEALNPHLCRCTGYTKIFEAVEKAAAVLRGDSPTANLLGNDSPNAIGLPVIPRDVLAKATGTTKYAGDIAFPGCGHIKILRSPHHHARITGIETAKALSAQGVFAVLTASDVEGTNILKMASDDQPVLCGDKVRFRGDPVAAVVAATPEMAEAALRLIEVNYEELPPVPNVAEAMTDATRVHDDRPNMMFRQPIVHGDVDGALASSDAVVEREYKTSRIEHAYMECDNGVAYVDGEGGLVVISGSQNIHQHKKTIAGALGREAERVRVIQPPMGGGFGGKLDVSVGGILGLAAIKTGLPVRLAFTREETFAATTKRHGFDMKVKMAAKADGALAALEMDIVADTGAYGSFGKSVLTRGLVHASGPYRFPNARLLGRGYYTNTAVCGAMRGFGVPQVAFALESALDELAEKLSIDPLALRLKNCYEKGDVTVCGQTLEDAVGMRDCLETLKPLYLAAKAEARRFSAGNSRRGVGIASVWFGPGRSAPDQSEAWAELMPDDTLMVHIGSADMGQGLNTAFWQIAATEMGYPLSRVAVSTADTATTPDGNFSAGSRQTYVSGRAVQLAVRELKKTMEAAGAASHAEMKAKGLPTLCKYVHKTSTTGLDPTDGHGTPWETYDFGVQMAEVEVDLTTGSVRVIKITAVHDLGTVINRMNLEGQLEGGIAMGLGYALKEEYVYDKSSNLGNYRIPRAKEMPEMEIITVDLPRDNGPFGASGAGEFADVPTAPAIINAIADACGARVRTLPATPERVLGAMKS